MNLVVIERNNLRFLSLSVVSHCGHEMTDNLSIWALFIQWNWRLLYNFASPASRQSASCYDFDFFGGLWPLWWTLIEKSGL